LAQSDFGFGVHQQHFGIADDTHIVVGSVGRTWKSHLIVGKVTFAVPTVGLGGRCGTYLPTLARLAQGFQERSFGTHTFATGFGPCHELGFIAYEIPAAYGLGAFGLL